MLCVTVGMMAQKTNTAIINLLQPIQYKNENGTFRIIQSSHQDIAWMDTPESCRKDRIHNIILPALEMMKQNKHFVFEMEQTLNLMDFLEEYPERKDELIHLYKEKKFTWGATYNQPYEGLSSGEQLVRQSYYGRKWVHENMSGCDDLVANNMDGSWSYIADAPDIGKKWYSEFICQQNG